MRDFFSQAKIKPLANQVELNLHCAQPELVKVRTRLECSARDREQTLTDPAPLRVPAVVKGERDPRRVVLAARFDRRSSDARRGGPGDRQSAQCDAGSGLDLVAGREGGHCLAQVGHAGPDQVQLPR